MEMETTWFIKTALLVCSVPEAAVSAKRCSDTQGCRIGNHMQDSGNSTYLVLQLKASFVGQPSNNLACFMSHIMTSYREDIERMLSEISKKQHYS